MGPYEDLQKKGEGCKKVPCEMTTMSISIPDQVRTWRPQLVRLIFSVNV